MKRTRYTELRAVGADINTPAALAALAAKVEVAAADEKAVLGALLAISTGDQKWSDS